MRGARLAALWMCAAGCGDTSSSGQGDWQGVAMPERTAVAEKTEKPEARHKAALVHPAGRCGECHGDKEAQWRDSPHAGSADGAAYLAFF